MLRAAAFLALVASLVGASGCASASLTRVTIHANVPLDAIVDKETERRHARDFGDTILLDHTRDHTLVVSAAGHETQELVLRSTTSGLRIAKTVICSLFPLYTLIGLPYDIYGKRWRTLEPDEVNLQLVPYKIPVKSP